MTSTASDGSSASVDSAYTDAYESPTSTTPMRPALPEFDVSATTMARPSTVTGELYNEVSAAYFNAVHSVLTGEASAADALQDLEDELVDITGFEVGEPPDVDVTASAGTLTGTGDAAAVDYLTRDYEGATVTASKS